MSISKHWKRSLALMAGAALLFSACGDSNDEKTAAKSETSSAAKADAPGVGGKAIGFIFVGPKDDFGYNQAAYDGSEAVKKAYPDLEILQAENVPETAEAERVVEGMIKKGAKIIFTTSFGHKDYALKIAARHPDVAVLQQGNVIEGKVPANIGTFFGNVYEPVYLAGIAAGKATKTNKLGYVAAFPIPQTLLNINAFQRGAASVNPAVETYTVFTSSWCDPGKQADAAKSLLGQGIDVLTQHQDCTGTIIKTAEAAGAMSVGYHADASSLAPKGWITGSEWDWGPLYVDMVKTVLAGDFTGSNYNDNFRAGYKSDPAEGELSPLVQSIFGPMVTDETKALVEKAKADISGAGSPFAGPVVDQNGVEKVPAGTIPSYADLENMDYLVKGVVGKMPS